jgi:hypothetical protein
MLLLLLSVSPRCDDLDRNMLLRRPSLEPAADSSVSLLADFDSFKSSLIGGRGFGVFGGTTGVAGRSGKAALRRGLEKRRVLLEKLLEFKSPDAEMLPVRGLTSFCADRWGRGSKASTELALPIVKVDQALPVRTWCNSGSAMPSQHPFRQSMQYSSPQAQRSYSVRRV